MFKLLQRNFRLSRIGLVRAATPVEVENLEGNVSPACAIVIVRNSGNIGRVKATGYVPRALVASGAMLRDNLLRDGIARSWAFVEDGALDINAQEVIHPGELLGSLDALVRHKVCGLAAGAKPIAGQDCGCITAVYPFENRFTYANRGAQYRQSYKINPVNKTVALHGEAIKEWPEIQADCGAVMPRVQTGVRYSAAPPRVGVTWFSTGGSQSELVQQSVRNTSNIARAAQEYLEYAKSSGRKPMTPSFAPAGVYQGKTLKALAAMGVDPFQFVLWLAARQSPAKAGVASNYLRGLNNQATGPLGA